MRVGCSRLSWEVGSSGRRAEAGGSITRLIDRKGERRVWVRRKREGYSEGQARVFRA